jgi:hypothetical protein
LVLEVLVVVDDALDHFEVWSTQIVLRSKIFGKFSNIVPFLMSQEEGPVENDQSWSSTHTGEAMHKDVLSLLVDKVIQFACGSEVTGNTLVMLEISDRDVLNSVNTSLSEHGLGLTEVDGSVLSLDVEYCSATSLFDLEDLTISSWI